MAQAVTATLRGVVADPGGEPLPGVTVGVRSASFGDAARSVVTDIRGRFKFPLLPPASDYYLLVDYPGFAAVEVGPIDLDAGRTTLQDIQLRRTDDLTERIEVTAHGNVVDTTATKSSTTFNTEFVEGLPIIGRNYQDILTLAPGVTDTDGDGNPNVQGSRETGLQYRLDGGNITDPASGTFGQSLNIDAIEEIEMISAGAGAEYGRADGGFANIITKSGGNAFEGSFRVFWRDRILDGNGAAENNDTFYLNTDTEFDLHDFEGYFTAGGAVRRDRLWYFLSVQRQDRSDPQNLAGSFISRTAEGHRFFGKLTWQVNPDNKMALQYSEDPQKITGWFLDVGVAEESDAELRTGGRTTQLKWTSIASPTLLVEALLTYYDAGVAIDPLSNRFRRTSIENVVVSSNSVSTIQAKYPVSACSADGRAATYIPFCDPLAGNPSMYQIDFNRGTSTGPYPFKTDDERIRRSIRSDFTYTLEDRWGDHQLKAGLEFANEKFQDEPYENPTLLNDYERCADLCADLATCPTFCFSPSTQLPDPARLQGFQVLSVPTPPELNQQVESFNSSLYLQDVWKPVPNMTVQLGVRIDQESIDSAGFKAFDPRREKIRSMGVVEGLCEDGLRVAQFGSGQSNASNACGDPKRIPGSPPKVNLRYHMDSRTPSALRKYDRNIDGWFDTGVDGPVWLDPYTSFDERKPKNFEIKNLNLSPRFSVSWDPWSDGRTKTFVTWGRYFDRLFLDTIDDEIGPDTVNYVFVPDPNTHTISPNAVSTAASRASLQQVDRDLQTPFTDVFTLGIEREIAPEWSVKVTYTQRLGWHLLQDTDINHLICGGFHETFGIRKTDVCKSFTDSSGKIHTSDDLFGELFAGKANLAPDLYNVNQNFNQVLRTGNYNSSSYRSMTFELQRRIHRNWQGRLNYTFSRVYGQAEDFLSRLGNDPSTSDDEEGYLDYDQRHRVILLATTILPKSVELGTSISWESGTPYSIIAQTVDQDDQGNVSFRTFYPTGTRNDQRNNGWWDVDLKVTKRFNLGDTAATASIAVNNILNDDDLTLAAWRASSFTGVELQQGPQGLRRFGRYWEIGFGLIF